MWLIVFGVFQILIGCGCGLMAPFMMFMAMMPQPPGMPPGTPDVRMILPAAVFYLLLAVMFIWLGIGSVRCRRWAWTLTVVLSWLWLLMGIMGTAAFCFLMPKILASGPPTPQVPPAMFLVIQIMTGGLITCIYLVVPGAFVLAYHRASVWATCQARDPQIRWTDRCPMPVLALSILLAVGAASMPMALVYHAVTPFFGVLLSGAAGAAMILLWAVLSAWLAWGTYRLKMAAWWGTLLMWIAMAISGGLTFSRVNPLEMYEKMGFPAAQLEMMRKTGVADAIFGHISWWLLPVMAVMLGYLLYVRRYFLRGPGQ
jgi:hypothetical protein